MVADPGRGPVLEAALTKLLHACAPVRCAGRGAGLQIVAMSATLGGLPSLCAWLGARLFVTDYRPVALAQHAVFRGAVFRLAPYGLEPEPLYALPPSPAPRDVDGLAPLVAQAVAARQPTIVFCGSRASTEACAALLANALPLLGCIASGADAEVRSAAVSNLQHRTSGTATPTLADLLAQGVAYHHAGMASEERAAVEAAFRGGAVLALAATSTLAAGVNLPAARVVLRSLRQGPAPVCRAQYLQMVGRAGRAGLVTAGESFVLAHPSERADVAALLSGPLPAVTSHLLTGGGKAAGGGPRPDVERLMLEAVTSGVGRKLADLRALLGRTLAAAQGAEADVVAAGADALARLRARGLLSFRAAVVQESVGLEGAGTAGLAVKPPPCSSQRQTSRPLVSGCFAHDDEDGGSDAYAAPSGISSGCFTSSPPPPAAPTPRKAPSPPPEWLPTPKGKAVVAACLPIQEAEDMYDELDRVLAASVPLDSAAVLVFSTLPRSSPGLTIRNWMAWERALARLAPRFQRAAAAVGVTPAYAAARARQGAHEPEADARHSRLATAVAACQLLDEEAEADVAASWAAVCTSLGQDGLPIIARGELQRLRINVSQRLSMGAALAAAAGWGHAELLLGRLGERAAAGVRTDLMPLARVPGMPAAHVRAVYDAGFTDPWRLGRAAEAAVARALLRSLRLGQRGGGGGEGCGGSAAHGAGAAWGGWAVRTARHMMVAAKEYTERLDEAAGRTQATPAASQAAGG